MKFCKLLVLQLARIVVSYVMCILVIRSYI
jgi:hypothetical protein